MIDTNKSLQLFDALPPGIEAALRASIERFGVLVPALQDQEGHLLDGHHRTRIAEELGVPCPMTTVTVRQDADRLEIVRSVNADRRQLTEEQRQEVALVLRREGHSERAIAGALGVPKTTIHRDISQLVQVDQLNTRAVAEDESSGGAQSPPSLPERIVGLSGKSYPARRPHRVAAKPGAAPGSGPSVRRYRVRPGRVDVPPPEEVRESPEVRSILISSMKREWQAMKQHYGHLQEFWEMVGRDDNGPAEAGRG